MFDPIEVFNFSDDDLRVICEYAIKVGTCDRTREKASMYEKVVN